MHKLIFDDVTLIYPFIEVNGIFNRKEKKKILSNQKQMPYTSNEGVVAVQHFSATINQGEFVVIIGPSGSGKTSILRMLAGLERPSLGNIYIDQEVINKTKPEDRDFAMVFQNYLLYENQTVYDNIAFPLRNQHLPRKEIEEKTNDIISLLKLNGKENRYPDELSGGEKQRVAIAKALVRRPKLFLLDEPFSSLDEMIKNSLRTELKRIQKELGITFIYVTHDQKDALFLADRIIVLKDGIMQQNDTTSNIYNKPKNVFCAKFVGYPTMNIFENIIYKNDGFEFYGKTYYVKNKKLKNDSKIKIGIRPFDIVISNEGVNATIDYTESDGNDLIIHTNIENKEVVVVEKNVGDSDIKYIHNQNIYLNFNSNRFYYFNENGERI